MTKRMALIDTSNNKVLQIIVTEDDWTGSNWYETTTNNYARIGGTYVNGKFIDPQPYPSWTIQDIETPSMSLCSDWVAPVEKPNDGKLYIWDEETLTWIEQ